MATARRVIAAFWLIRWSKTILPGAWQPFRRIASPHAIGYGAAESRFHQGNRTMAGAPKAEGGHPAMDYAEHEKTYEGFLRFSVIGTIWCLVIVVGLAIGATGKSWGMGSLMIVLGTALGVVGIFSKAIDHKGVTAVLILALLVWAGKALH
jgi:Bacterial aa3 type cytochrome c oxidase subunit IV